MACWTATNQSAPGALGTGSSFAASRTNHQLQQLVVPNRVSHELTPAVYAALQQLQQQLRICEVGKAVDSYRFVCPQYAQLLVMLLHTTDSKQTSDTIDGTIDDL